MAKKDKPVEAMPMQDDYETKGHLQDLIRAHEIMMDEKKMKKVKKMAKMHQKAIRSIQDLKDFASEKYGPKSKMEVEVEDGEE